MPRSKKTDDGSGHHSLLAAVEKQYLAALRFSRDQIDRRIKMLEETIRDGASGSPSPGKGKGAKPGSPPEKQLRKPRNYEVLKAKITKPMTMQEMLKALGMKEKQEGTLRQTIQNYPGLLKSDGKRPATYTLDTSR